ncbi:MAG TPA: hypothetical protein VMW69_17035 [Spirochaetia bacterium]|nr:hypothetical protein [Spirochaetia bacterium]
MNKNRRNPFRKLAAVLRGGVRLKGSAPTMNARMLGQFVEMVMSSREDEISCDECGERLSEFAELTLAGKSASDAIPLVEDHLKRCMECREEFEALLEALRQSD